MRQKGMFCTILSALLFGVTPLLASITYQMGSNAETLTFYRNLLVVPILFVVLFIRGTGFCVNLRQLAAIFSVGILGRGITTLMLYASYDYVGIGIATTLHFLYPLAVALICRFLFHDKLGRARLIALIMAGVGILFFLDRSSGGHLAAPGIILALLSSITYSFYIVGMEKTVLNDMDPFQVSFYMAIAVSLAMLLYNLPMHKIVFALPPKALLLTFVIAVCTSLLAVVLFQLGIRCLSATTAAIFSLFEPISSTLCGILFLSEPFTASKLIGSIVILTAVVILALFKPGLSAEPKQEESAV